MMADRYPRLRPIRRYCGRNAVISRDSCTRNGGIVQLWRSYRLALRDMEVRHARERAALTAWTIECQHHLGTDTDVDTASHSASTRGPAGVGVPEVSGGGVSVQGGHPSTPKNFGKIPA